MNHTQTLTRLLSVALMLGITALLVGQPRMVDAQSAECLDSNNVVCLDVEGDVEIGVPPDTLLNDNEFFTVHIPTAARQRERVHFGNGEHGLWFTNGSQRGFFPFLYGIADDQRTSMFIAGSTTSQNDIGRDALVNVEGRYHGGADGGVIKNRPIFSVTNFQQPSTFLVDHNNRVGIGMQAPNVQLEVQGAIHTNNLLSFASRNDIGHYVEKPTQGERWAWYARNGVARLWTGANNSNNNGIVMVAEPDGNVGIGISNPSSKLHVNGTTTTSVLQITGGADLAEPFAINDTTEVEPGTVVILDADNPGEMRVANGAYDPLVAGIISGAGDIQPGLIMQQEEETTVNGEMYPVALTGKVYVKAVGPIQIGDLLTTADVAGHAMVATNREKAFGATLGKAMSPLDEGETGLVLVLVALQ